jgi:hypothetical protein
VAYQSVNNEHLWSGPTVADPHDTGLIMAAGTSPSSPSNAGNPAEAAHLAYQAHNGHLTITTGSGAPTDTGLAMAPGTSPASVIKFSGAALDVFQGANGHLWTYEPGGGGDTGLAMAAGTSPCAAVLTLSGELEIGFQAPNGELRNLTDAGAVNNTGLTMRAGTSPAITTDGRHEDYQFAIQSSDGHLATFVHGFAGETFSKIWPWPLAAGTSPGVAAQQDKKFVIFLPGTAFQGNNGHLWTLEPVGGNYAPIDTGLPMKPGTSPTVVPLTFG